MLCRAVRRCAGLFGKPAGVAHHGGGWSLVSRVPCHTTTDRCQFVARAQIIRGQAGKGQLPPVGEYLDAAKQRLREMAGLQSDLVGFQST